MNIASIIEQFREPFLRKYGHQLMPGHLRALDAITACKTRCGISPAVAVTVTTRNPMRSVAAIAAAHAVKTRRPVSGFTGNSKSSFRRSILW